jgi:DNA polymerase III subunit epsilon
MDFVAIDFETANESRRSACAVGVTHVVDGRIARTESWLIRPPELRFAPIHVAIHGITAAHVRDMPSFPERWRPIWDACAGRPLVAHNASFDLSVLRQLCDWYRMPYPALDYFCTLVIARAQWPVLASHSLPTVAAHLGIRFAHHDPAEDARAAAEIALRALDEAKATTLAHLAAMHELRSGRLHPGGYVPCGIGRKARTPRA